MKKTIQKIGFTAAIFIMLTTTLFAQVQPPVPATSDNFRINVMTNINGDVNGGGLNLVLELLNNGSSDVVFAVPDGPAPTQTPALPGEPGDGDPGMPVIGVASLTRLDIPPLVEDDGQADTVPPGGPQPVNEIPLQLFGNPAVPGHSTVVISLARFPLNRGPAPQDPNEPPMNLQEPPQDSDQPTGLRPGLYLLDCQVNAIDGVAPVHAEKIIAIPLPPLPPHDNGRRPHQAQAPQQQGHGHGPNQQR